MRNGNCWLGIATLGLALAGCNHQPAPVPPHSQASESVVRRYGEALQRQDWPTAYAVLHPDSCATLTEAQFAQRAAHYSQALGFTPLEVFVNSCEERGAAAVAHLTFRGRKAERTQNYKETLILRQEAGSWRVVLPTNFGR